MWAQVSSSTPHLLLKGLLGSPIKWRCLPRVLCPVRRPVTTLDFILLKDRSLVFAPGLGPEINSLTCLWVLPRPRHLANCWLSIQHFIFLLIFCVETPKDGSGPTNVWKEPFLGSLSAISFLLTQSCPLLKPLNLCLYPHILFSIISDIRRKRVHAFIKRIV
jgi:hypothetical protein